MATYNPKQLFRELRRRRLFNTVAVYIVGAWVVIQAADLAFPGFDVPASALAYVWLAALLLFPLVLVLGWKYDIHVSGIRRTPAVDAGGDFDPSLQSSDRWLIGGIGAVAVAVISVLLLLIGRVEPEAEEMTPDSIAVMPFNWCSEGAGDIALAGGIHAAVIDRLAARDRLKVIGRNSVYKVASFGLQDDRVSDLLRVQYLLHGELCRDRMDLVLRAELTDRDQAIVWNGSFRQVVVRGDQVEQQLASLVANGIALQLGDAAVAEQRAPVNVRALELLRIAQYHVGQNDGEKALAAVEEALEYQPDFAQALFYRAYLKAEFSSGATSGAEEAMSLSEEALAAALAEIERGTRDWEPYYVAARILMMRGWWTSDLTWRQAMALDEAGIAAKKATQIDMLREAEGYLREAIRLNPSEPELRIRLVWNLEQQGSERRGEALHILEQARLTEPFDEDVAVGLARNLAQRGQYAQAMEELERFRELGEISAYMRWMQLEIQVDYGAEDDRLALLLEMLQNETDKYTQHPPAAMGHLWWASSHLPYLGLRDEAAALHDRLAAIPERAGAGYLETWGRQHFLHDWYREATGRGEEVTREQLNSVEGLSNEEILDGNPIEAMGVAQAFWKVGDRDRSVELLEALHHFRWTPTYAQRAQQLLLELAWRYVAEGREAEAKPVLEEMVDLLEAELAAGVRHPMVLRRLAQGYALQGHYQEALEMLTMAVDYGHWDDAMVLPEEENPFDDVFETVWQPLADDPSYQEQLRRQEAIVERQASNIRALLAAHDIDRLLEPVIEAYTASSDQAAQTTP